MSSSKTKSVFVCQNCGYESPKWMGRCPFCGHWNAFVETKKDEVSRGRKKYPEAIPIKLDHVKDNNEKRRTTGINELDWVLGGGLVPGGVILLAGEPGIGKSTLLLQLAARYPHPPSSAKNKRQSIFYVCGEESPSQIRIRAQRLAIKTEDILLLPTTDVDSVLAFLNKEEKPVLLIVDSIQTMTTADLSGSAGSVGQVRESAARLIRWAKEKNVPLFLVGHITKGGVIAGPKVLEHAVDTVVYFEGDPYGQLRLLRASKNRFGRTGEVGVFRMADKGLVGVSDPSRLFLSKEKGNSSGAMRTIILEGTRPLVLEVQAIVTKSNLVSPRRLARGIDRNRLELYVAVLQKHLSLPLYREDVILNIAGGVKVDEPAVDLAACLAIWSSYKNKITPFDLISFGEVGLLGRIRKVREEARRIKEAKRLGYKKIISADNVKSLREAIGKLKVKI